MSCKNNGFVTYRHNEIRDILSAKLLSEVCKDVQTEPTLSMLTGDEFYQRTTNRQQETRLDVKAKGFWIADQTTYLDIRIFDPNASRYKNNTIKQCYAKNQMEKKRQPI